MGTQNWTPLLCDCTMSQDNGDTPGGPVAFIEFVNICDVHAAAISANPRVAYDTISKESQDHSKALNAIIDTELGNQWVGMTWQKVDAAVAKAIADGEITDPLELMITDPALVGECATAYWPGAVSTIDADDPAVSVIVIDPSSTTTCPETTSISRLPQDPKNRGNPGDMRTM